MISLLFILLFLFASGEPSSATNQVIKTVAQEVKNPTNFHKVHNLVLNPDQHSWCELKHILQIVTHAHCTSKELENYVCVGTCFSYSVPQTEPETPGDELLDYCDSCQPAQSHWSKVVLDCEDDDGNQYQVTKNIQMITNCSCSACSNVVRPPLKIQSNDVIPKSEHRLSEPFYKNMLPNSHKNLILDTKDDRVVDLKDDLRYSKMSLADIKKEIKLNPDQELLLSGKTLIKDVSSFVDDQEGENSVLGFAST